MRSSEARPRVSVVIPTLNGGERFEKVLGASWVPAAFYAQIMSVGWMVAQIGVPLHMLPVLLNRLKLQFFFEIGSQAGRLAAVLAAYALDSFPLCLALLAAVEILSVVTFGGALYRPIVNSARKAPPVPAGSSPTTYLRP